MPGVVPSEEFNEQLKRTVRESISRSQLIQQLGTKWHKKGGGTGERVYFSVVDIICPDDSYDDTYDETTLICQWEAHPSTPPGLNSDGELEVVEHWGRILDIVTIEELTALVDAGGVFGSATRTKDRVDQGTWVGTDAYWHLDALHIRPNCEE